MRRAGLFAALMLLVVVNVAVLGGVAWNRAGQPAATLRLTERELPLYDSFVRAEENSGLALQLTLYQGSYSPDWLDEQKLRTLGFRPERYDTTDAAEGVRNKQALPRQAWVVLEFDGPAWQLALAESETELASLDGKIQAGESTLQQREYRQESLEQMRQSSSRLLAVDAGTDAAVLRERYPDTTRYLMTRAVIHLWVAPVLSPQEKGDRPRVRGTLQLPVERINVPLQLRAVLQTALGGDVQNRAQRAENAVKLPRYSVVLNVGARHEPWLADIKPLDVAATN
ncbi:MAG TPA: DUF4824 family protein [Gammaproteobacteria bacterium]|nr:DUF4824 family protein [Gammaproteobacteria bacterium]